MNWTPVIAVLYVVATAILLCPVYDQLVPIEETGDMTEYTLDDQVHYYSVEIPEPGTIYPLTRCGYLADAYRFTEPDEHIQDLVDDMILQTGYSGWELVEYMRDMVHAHIQYVSDSEAHGKREYWQLPCETLYYGTGDCEDQAFLFVSMCRAAGFDCILVSEKKHMSAAVDVEGEGNRVSYEGKSYLVADPVSSRDIGHNDPDVKYLYGCSFGREQIVFFLLEAFLFAFMNLMVIRAFI